MTKRFVLLLLSFILVKTLPAWGRREKEPVVEVTGIVRLVGNVPFSELVITGNDKEWYVAREDQHKLWDFQHRLVTVEGVETVMTLTFANGFPAGERRTLKEIKIIAVQ